MSALDLRVVVVDTQAQKSRPESVSFSAEQVVRGSAVPAAPTSSKVVENLPGVARSRSARAAAHPCWARARTTTRV